MLGGTIVEVVQFEPSGLLVGFAHVSSGVLSQDSPLLDFGPVYFKPSSFIHNGPLSYL